MVPIDQFEVLPGIFYVNHPHHRDPANPDKSQWTIAREYERDVFRITMTRHWCDSRTGWGLHTPDGLVQYLGRARALPGETGARLFVAKFVHDITSPIWHGYPADHERHPSNIPPEPLLKSWGDAGFIRWAAIAKVLRGKPCSL